MLSIYMDNFRGFKSTIIPIVQTTFLVGENSTGKSSFLKLLHFLFTDDFWLRPSEVLYEQTEMKSFNDMVSIAASDRHKFSIGFIQQGDTPDICQAVIFDFFNLQGLPQLLSFQFLHNSTIVNIVFEQDSLKYRIHDISTTHDLTQPPRQIINTLQSYQSAKGVRFKKIANFPKGFRSPPLAIAFIDTQEQIASKKERLFMATTALSNLLKLVWIAPIRARPKRLYDGLRHQFSAEGEHTPFVLRSRLNKKSHIDDFLKKLKNFGIASGLFADISVHSYGKGPQAPFEILINLSRSAININNVGYGVAQALPLITEFLSRDQPSTFAVQQPEVHLHPRAQAAFGDLLYSMATEIGHSFIIETHSDFLIDRFRYALSIGKKKIDSEIVYFQRDGDFNSSSLIKINEAGRYQEEQPVEFRKFFVNESLRLLDL